MKTDLHLDYEAIAAGQAETVHLALQFTAKAQPAGRASPFAFGLVIDNSGSMEGRPLEFAKKAAEMAVTHLRPDDQCAVVVFSESARTVVPFQKAASKAALVARIQAIQSEGSTNLTAGWMLGRDELRKAPAGMPRKLLLLSDGHLNAGIVEPPRVRGIVGDGLEKDAIRTSCLGFGDGYNEDLLADLAKASSGALHDADSPEKFPGIFGQELESLLKLSTQNLRVRVKKLHYCSGVALLGGYPVIPLPEGGAEITVGDLVSDEVRGLVLALEVLPLPKGEGLTLEGEPLLDVEIQYDEMDGDAVVSRTETRTVRILAAQRPEDVQINETVVRLVAEQLAARALEEMIPDRDQGNLDAVKAKLEKLRERLGRYHAPEAVKPAEEQIRRFMEFMEDWSARSRKMYRFSATRMAKSSTFYTTEQDADITSKPPRRRPSAGATPGGTPQGKA